MKVPVPEMLASRPGLHLTVIKDHSLKILVLGLEISGLGLGLEITGLGLQWWPWSRSRSPLKTMVGSCHIGIMMMTT